MPLPIISGTGAIPLANLRLDCGLCATAILFSAIISISSSVTWTQCAANVVFQNNPKSCIWAIGVLPVAFITFSTSPFVSDKCIWMPQFSSWDKAITFSMYVSGQVYGACGPSNTLIRSLSKPFHVRNKSAFSTNAWSAVGDTPAKPRDSTARIPVSFTTSAVVFIKKYISLKVVVPERNISAMPSCVPYRTYSSLSFASVGQIAVSSQSMSSRSSA